MSNLIQTVPTSVLDATKVPVDLMVDEVAGLVGGAQNLNARAKALIALDRAADRMNSVGLFLFRRKEVTYDSLTAGQTTLDLPADWGWPFDPARALDASGDILSHLEWKTWDVFKRLSTTDDDTGVPSYLSMLDDANGPIYVWRGIDAGDVDSIIIPYVARVQRPSEAEDLTLTPETREAMIQGGEYYITRHRYLKFPQIYRELERTFLNAIDAALSATNRWISATHPAAVPELVGHITTQGETMTNNRIGVGAAYIKVG